MRYLLGCIFSLLSFSSLLAQEEVPKFYQLSVEDGLSNNHATCIFQDSKGFIWIGTHDGLNLYDGYEFTHFKHNPKNPKSISNNIIWAIHEDKIGNLWIGTQDGLNRFDRKTYSFTAYKHHQDTASSLLNNQVYAILEDKAGYLWVGTEQGISRLDRDRKKFTHFQFSSYYDIEKYASVKTLFQDKAGNILAGTYGAGIMARTPNGKDFQLFALYPDSLRYEFIQSIHQDNKGNYWIGSIKGLRIISADKQFFSFTPYSGNTEDIDFNQITSIAEDKEQNIWLGTLGGGVVKIYAPFLFAKMKFHILRSDFKNPQTLSRDLVNQIFIDKMGAVWVGTQGGGISIHDEGRDKFELFRHESENPNSLSNDVVNAFHESKDGILWIGTAGGLNKYDRKNKKFTVFKHNPADKNTLSDDYLTCIFPSKKGGLWIGTSNGLNYFDEKKGTFQVFKKDLNKAQTLNDNHIISLWEDEQGILWIGTLEGGLNKFNPQTNTFTIFENIPQNPNSLSENTVQAILQDREGFLWIGTNGGGLNRFDKKTEQFTVFKNQAGDSLSLSHNSIKCLYEDSQGNIWIGTHGGLDKLDKKKGVFSNFNRNDGLPSNTIHGILEDRKGYLWLSTNVGISHFWTKENEFHNYDQYDNLQSNEFNTGAFFKNHEGKMYFGGNNGFNAFLPDSVENNMLKPLVYFTHLRINGKKVEAGEPNSPLKLHISATEKIVLTYEQNTITFDFVALNFRHSEKNEYRWKLEGYDKDWTKPSNARTATYTNLPSGKYTFLVKASNNDGVWNEVPARIVVEIQKAIWDTWWFRMLVVLVIGAVVFGVYKVRVYQIELQNKRLEEQVKERTLEISQQKDEILKINEELQTKQEEILAQKQDIIAKNEYLEKANKAISEQRNQIEKALHDIQVISEIGQKITSLSHHEFFIETVFENISELVEVDMFRVGVIDKQTKKIVFQGFSEKKRITAYYHDFSTSEGQHLSLWCIENKKEIFINDFDNEYNLYIPNGKLNASIKNQPKSLIYLPLMIEEECIGVMTLQSYKKNAYTQENLNILKTLSTFTSIALDNYANHNNLQEANKKIAQNNENILSSIRYAEKIQQAILPDDQLLKNALGEYFVIFLPQAIVSGDFYWCKQIEDKTFLAVVDCTGHGVPGAFMSIIGNTLLNDVISRKIYEPSQILEELHMGIRLALRQDSKINDDGMDIGLCLLEKQYDEKGKHSQTKIIYAGAKRPLYYVVNGKLETLAGNRRSLGGGRNIAYLPFSQETVYLPKGAMIYLTTDGFADQNNPAKEKIGSTRLKEWLQNIADKEPHLQDLELLTKLSEYMVDDSYQRDDITIIGVRV